MAGGLATRLRPITEKIPKSLIEVNGEPFIAHQLRLLRNHGINQAVLCVGHLGEMIQTAIGDGSAFGVNVEYSFDGPTLLGTAGAIRKALPKLGAEFLVIYGDSYLPCDYNQVAQKFTMSSMQGLMTVFHNEGKWDTSNVEFTDGKILAYSKQERSPRMRYIDYGLGVFRAEAFSQLPEDKPYDLAMLYGDLLRHRQLAGFEVHERFYEIGSAAGLQETTNYLAAQKVSHS
ncbi:MAG TPA: nucleotidyltransferase family protein [Terriglobales bacterium]|nr:nucleotidyltransferase family protein [Terriglobales bacterium]